jgi:hypothetical protein
MRSVPSPWLTVHKISQGIGIDLEDSCNFSQASPLFVETLDLPKFFVQVPSSPMLGWCQAKVRKPWFVLLSPVPSSLSRRSPERCLTPQGCIKHLYQITMK